MSYQEKRTIVMMFSGALVLAAYCIYAFGQVNAGAVMPDDLKFWARTMLIFIGIGIAAAIIIQIVFHILLSIGIAITKKIQDQDFKEEEIEKSIKAEMVEDEMDRLIELKSNRVGFTLGGFGFAAALILILLGYSTAVMLNVIFLSFSAGSIIEGFVQLYYYRKGIRHA